jgi:hypothetical protein
MCCSHASFDFEDMAQCIRTRDSCRGSDIDDRELVRRREQPVIEHHVVGDDSIIRYAQMQCRERRRMLYVALWWPPLAGPEPDNDRQDASPRERQ